MTTEVELFLAHAGVKGMKWGIRKKRPAPTGRPSMGRQIAFGALGNRKSRYQNPAALKKKTTSGKAFITALALSAGGLTMNMIANNNPSVQTGARAAAAILNLGSTAAGITSAVTGIQGTHLEKKSRTE